MKVAGKLTMKSAWALTAESNLSDTHHVEELLEELQQKNRLLLSLEQPDVQHTDRGTKSQVQMQDILSLSRELSLGLAGWLNRCALDLQTTAVLVPRLWTEQTKTACEERANSESEHFLKEIADLFHETINCFREAENSLHHISCKTDALISETGCSAEHAQSSYFTTCSFPQSNDPLQKDDSAENCILPNCHLVPQQQSTFLSDEDQTLLCNMATNKNIIELKEQTAALCVSVPNDKGENRIFTSQVQTVNAPQAEENAENPRSKESDNLSNITHNNAESTSNPNGINRNENNLFTQEKRKGILENNTYEKQNSQTDEYENPKQWFTNELLAEVDDQSEPTIAGYIVAPSIVVQRLECKIISSMSPLIVSDAEELVSNIISIKCADTRIKVPFPVTISIPFCTRHRGSYRDIIVKVMDDHLQTCYLNPISLEGIYGGQKGSFAEVRVYKLGVFAVVSCLRKEIFTIPKKGILIKLNVDSRISFNYQPGSFNSPVIVQTKVQPIDTLLFSIIKSRQEVFHAIVSTSPLVYILHPSTQPFKKPITVTVPCPPNPDKRKQRDELDHSRPATAAVPNVTSTQQIRVSSASVRKHGDTAKETLKLLGYKAKEELWTVVEVNVRNLQNGLITFDISEHLERLIVFRLSISIDASHLIQFVEELEKGTYNTMVKVIIYRKKDEINSAVLLVVPSKDLNFELANLREEGYIGPPEPSESISVQEGDQLILHFSGNISAYDSGHEALQGKRFTFHLQRKLRLVLYLRVNDEFGNYSSPHYKGTALLYKLSRNTAAKFWDKSIYPNDYQQNTPVCKLALTLPKRERIVNRPSSAKSISSDSTDPLSETVLYWLSEELSEEDAALLVISLRIRRSAIQIVKLKIPDNLTEQIFELLLIWRKSLPASANKTRLLSHHLCKCGRDDLAEELKSKSENI